MKLLLNWYLFVLLIHSGECSIEELSSLELTEFQVEHISSQQRKYDAKAYNIDWEEVKTGKAAGMPGGWVSYGLLNVYT